MSLSFDLLLLYYDNPGTLNQWLTRLLRQTDYLEFPDSRLIVVDTGSPAERIPATIEVLRQWRPVKPTTYVRVDTDELRGSYPSDIEIRPTSAAMNVGWQRVSRAPLLVHAILSNIFPPKYFSHVVDYHQAEPRLFLQPRQFSLESQTYFDLYADRPFAEVMCSGPILPWNGLPDFSVRREHLEQIGGWDEDYIAWGMCDIDLCTRLTGLTDLEQPVEHYYRDWFGQLPESPYQNLGLKLLRPHTPDFFSLICNQYAGRVAIRSHARAKAIQLTLPLYFQRWGQIVRNQGKAPLTYQVHEV